MRIFRKQISILQIIELFVIIASICFLFWRCKYGYSFNDEPLFITFAERLFNGDILYTDEWHVAQNIGVVIYPFYRVFRIFNDTNDGIIMTFRYIYCLLWTLTCLYVYKTFRKEYKLTIFVILFLMFFQPLDYSSLSYTSISLMCVLIICCNLYKLPNEDIGKKKVIKNGAILGLLFIVLVLCVPLMAVPYFLTITILFFVDNKQKAIYINNIRIVILISLVVCFAVFLIYISFLLMNTSTDKLIYGVNKMLNSHSHMNIGLIFDDAYQFFQKMPILCIASFITCIFSSIDKSHIKVKYILFILCALIYCCYIYKNRNEILVISFNYQMLYIPVLGFTSYFLLEDKPKKMFRIFWSFSIAYVIFQGCLSSDTRLMAIAMDLVPGSVAGILCITKLIQEALNKRNISKSYIVCIMLPFVSFIALVCQLSFQLYVRLNRQYWDKNFKELNTVITTGAARGLYTSTDQAGWYEDHIYRLKSLIEKTV